MEGGATVCCCYGLIYRATVWRWVTSLTYLSKRHCYATCSALFFGLLEEKEVTNTSHSV